MAQVTEDTPVAGANQACTQILVGDPAEILVGAPAEILVGAPAGAHVEEAGLATKAPAKHSWVVGPPSDNVAHTPGNLISTHTHNKNHTSFISR